MELLEKNIIRDGGSTAPESAIVASYTAYTAFVAYTMANMPANIAMW